MLIIENNKKFENSLLPSQTSSAFFRLSFSLNVSAFFRVNESRWLSRCILLRFMCEKWNPQCNHRAISNFCVTHFRGKFNYNYPLPLIVKFYLEFLSFNESIRLCFSSQKLTKTFKSWDTKIIWSSTNSTKLNLIFIVRSQVKKLQLKHFKIYHRVKHLDVLHLELKL